MFTGEVTDADAEQLGWDPQVIVWFAFVNETLVNASSDVVPITIILTDSGLYTSDSGTPTANTVDLVIEFANTVGNGTLNIRLADNKPVKIIHLDACRDINCTELYMKVTSPSPVPTVTSAASSLERVACYSTVLMMLLVALGVIT
jgi:hypothetical protein